MIFFKVFHFYSHLFSHVLLQSMSHQILKRIKRKKYRNAINSTGCRSVEQNEKCMLSVSGRNGKRKRPGRESWKTGSQRYLETKDTGTQCKQEKRQSYQPQGTSLVSKSKAQLSLMILFSFSKMYLA